MRHESVNEGHNQQKSDEALILEVRENSASAYAQLYERHAEIALATAYRHARNSSDAEDLVSEGFANVLHAIKSGKGPTVFFRAYLLTTIRRLASVKRTADSKAIPVDDLQTVEPVVFDADPAVSAFDTETVARSFQTLPERWQAVLWYMEIDGLTPASVAPLLGMTPNAVSALAVRAREGLRQAYLQSHLLTEPPAACATFADQLGAYARDGLTPRRSKKVRAHVDNCLRCTEMLLHLEDVGVGMRGIIFPAIVGLAFVGPNAAAVGSAVATAGAGLGAQFGSSGTGAGSGAAAGGMSLTTILAASAASLVLVGVVVVSAVGLPNFGNQNEAGKSVGDTATHSPGTPAPAASRPQAFAPPSLLNSKDEPLRHVEPEAVAPRALIPVAQIVDLPVTSPAYEANVPAHAIDPAETYFSTPAGKPSASPLPSPAQSKPTNAPISPAVPTPVPIGIPSAQPTPSPQSTPAPSPTRTAPKPPVATPPTTPPTTPPVVEPSVPPTTPPTTPPVVEPSVPPTTPPVKNAQFSARVADSSGSSIRRKLRLDLATVDNAPVENVQVRLRAYTYWRDNATVSPPLGWDCKNPESGVAGEQQCLAAAWDGSMTAFEISVPDRALFGGIYRLDLLVTADGAEDYAGTWTVLDF